MPSPRLCANSARSTDYGAEPYGAPEKGSETTKPVLVARAESKSNEG